LKQGYGHRIWLVSEFIVLLLPDGQAVFGVVPFVETYQDALGNYFQSADGSSSDDVNQHCHRHFTNWFYLKSASSSRSSLAVGFQKTIKETR